MPGGQSMMIGRIAWCAPRHAHDKGCIQRKSPGEKQAGRGAAGHGKVNPLSDARAPDQ